MAQLMDAGVSDELAARVASMSSLPPVFDIVAVAEATGRKLEDVMVTYFGLGYRLELNWLRDRILELSRANRWQALARAALRDDLLAAHRDLTREVLETAGDGAVGPAVLVSVAVTPANPSIAKGASQQFSATGSYSDGTTQNLSSTVAWASQTTGVGTGQSPPPDIRQTCSPVRKS